MISLDKKNLPGYIYKLNVALLIFFALWFTAGVAAMVTVGCIYGESVITYAVMGGVFALFFLGLAIFLIADNKLHKRLIDERAAELEKEFIDMPFEEAERILKESGVITDYSFIVNDDGVLGKNTVPFESAKIEFLFYSVSTHIYLSASLYNADGKIVESFELNRALCNFLRGKKIKILNAEHFELFVKDKKAFVKFVYTWGHRLFQRAQISLN